ncbi:MAG: glycosyltransferase [Opitutaceae bacterium]
MTSERPAVAYLFTTFPKETESFLQREIAALRAAGVPLRLYSMWGGKASFRGMPVERFRLWRLVALVWVLPAEACRRPGLVRELLRGLFRRRPPSWINFWENLLGAGFACVQARRFRRDPPALVHAPWAGAPATAAWILWRADGHRFSAAAHAYDIFEHGGDWWLREKLADAAFVHTSTDLARRALIERGVPAAGIVRIRRGLERIPAMKPLRASRSPLRLLSVARLVEKKGVDRQLRIYAALRAAGVPFAARIVGDGPLRGELERLAARLGVSTEVTFTGALRQPEVWTELAGADVLLHTGVVAPSGDRDGLPNVIAEAMAAGVVVIASPAGGAAEAVADGINGIAASPEDPPVWVAALRRLAGDDAFAEALRAAAHAWVEENFDAHRNAARLKAEFERAMGVSPPPPPSGADPVAFGPGSPS